jgi:hypothetical protein
MIVRDQFFLCRYTGDFTDVMVPATSTISWAIPFDKLTFLANGVNQSVGGALASVDIYRSYTFLSSSIVIRFAARS